MTAADWITDLARRAEAFPARERTWHMHEMDRVFVGPGEPGNLDGVVHMSADPLSDLDEKGAGEERRNGAWIAAANPATILRLIAALDSEGTLAMVHRDLASLYREERDALAARLAAVEALADEWDRRAQLAESTADARAGLSDEVSLRQHAVVMSNRAHDLRAALAAPTDTTKEN